MFPVLSTMQFIDTGCQQGYFKQGYNPGIQGVYQGYFNQEYNSEIQYFYQEYFKQGYNSQQHCFTNDILKNGEIQVYMGVYQGSF